MRSMFVALSFGAAVLVGSSAVLADSIEVKGPHICCKQCVNVATKILEKIDGVSDIKTDAKSKSVTFTAKDEKSAKAGYKALIDGGFFGTATRDGKELSIDIAPLPTGAKADVIVVKDVHVCCGQCQNGVAKALPDTKISYEGKGPQRTVRVEGTSLEPAGVLQALRKAGFNGVVQK